MSVKTFLAELFDANFNRLLTLPTVKIFYVVGLAATTAFAGAVALGALNFAVRFADPAYRIPIVTFGVVAGLGLFLAGAFVSRLLCEAWIVFYRIGRDTRLLVELGGGIGTSEHDAPGLAAEAVEIRRAVA